MQGIIKISKNKDHIAKILFDNTEISIDNDIIKRNKLLHNDKILYNENNNEIILLARVEKIFGALVLNDKIVSIKNGKILKKFIPIDNRYPEFMVQINKNLKDDKNNKYCSIKFKKWAANYVVGTIVNIFGNIGDYNTEKAFLKHKYIPISKNNYKMEEIIDLTPNRIDLTNLLTFSIDPDNCQDIDDAFSILINDEYMDVYIHISDVSSYILPQSELDNILFNRSETVYLTNEQINMLPNDLATNECSLKQNKISRAFTTVFTLDKDGNIINVQSYKSLIKNKYNLSYDIAQEIINCGDHNDLELYNGIINLYDLGKKIKISNFNVHSYDCHKMVEIYMLLINNHVGNIIGEYDPINCIMRSCKQLVNKNVVENNVHLDMANLLLINRAEYKVGIVDSKHEQLDLLRYTHFSSPIRRYVDIVIHRMYYSAIMGEKNNEKFNGNGIIVNIVNNKSKIIKKICREDKLLDLIFDIEYNHNSILNINGIIVGINDNEVTIYVKQYKIFLRKKLFPSNCKRSIDYIFDDHSITIGNTRLQLFDTINVDLVTSIKAIYLKNKLLINMVNPKIVL